MIVVCAWCQTVLGVKAPEDDIAVSHGICRGCSERAVPFDIGAGQTAQATRSADAFFPMRAAGSRTVRTRS